MMNIPTPSDWAAYTAYYRPIRQTIWGYLYAAGYAPDPSENPEVVTNWFHPRKAGHFMVDWDVVSYVFWTMDPRENRGGCQGMYDLDKSEDIEQFRALLYGLTGKKV